MYLYICRVVLFAWDWIDGLVLFIVFNATSNNIAVISWRSVLLVEETGVPVENNRPAVNHWQTLSQNVVLSTPRLSGIQTYNVSGDKQGIELKFIFL
jgi:hypothetical protein